MSTCLLEVSDQQFDDIQKCEAVVVREYSQADGSRFARVVAWGDESEMQIQVDIPGVFVVPIGFSIVKQQIVLVKDLLGPKDEAEI